MKRFFKIILSVVMLIVSNAIFAQKYYDAQWKKISQNAEKGLYKSNLPIISAIKNQAMKDNNAVQLIRSLKAEFSVVNQTEDDEKNDSASRFFAKLIQTEKKMKGNDLLFYNVLLNDFVTEYYSENQWKINRLTNINSQDVSQIETWSKLDFKNYLSNSFKNLDLEVDAMQKIKLSDYKNVLYNTENSDYFPTLKDWYLLKKITFLSDRALFTKNEIAENKVKVNEIYDDLITRNSGNAKLYYMHQKMNSSCFVNECKNKLAQLETLMKSRVEGDYKVLIAQEIMNELVAKNRQKEALELADSVKKQYPKSPFLKNLKNIENQITNASLVLKFEQQTQPNKPIHLVAEAKNLSAFSLKIFEVKDDIKNFLNYSRSPYNNAFEKVKKSLVKTENFSLPDAKDYQNHTTSMEIKPLPAGIYLAEYIISNDAGSKDESNQRQFWFLVSDNSIIYQKKENAYSFNNEMKLINAENGKSVSNEDLVFYESGNDKILSKFSGKTDANGVFRFPDSKNKDYYRNYLIYQSKSNSFQLMDIYGNRAEQNDEPENNIRTKAQIFTDRAIYRPGQTVYFKVINTKIDQQKESVFAGIKQKITLKDVNGQDISSQDFTTNEFGSYHGSFILPKGKLNGNFSLVTNGNAEAYKYFQVEEYKRPKFEVTFEPVKSEYKYGETIELKGKAMTFSGIALSNVTVNYEIKKQNIRWMYFPWYPQDYGNENSILGEAKTNDKGEFTIRLDLKKDENVEGIQIDNFAVNASVTDISGETQSADTNLKVASVTHFIKADAVENAFDDEKIEVKVETKNYSEQNLKKTYQAKLSKLEGAERVFRSNFESEIQDLPKFSKSEFISKFPHDLYDKNDAAENRKVSQIIFTKENSSEKTLDIGKLPAGDYRLELYNIEGKDTIKTMQNFSVWNKKMLSPAQKTFLTVVAPNEEIIRGEKEKIFVYSAIPDALVNVFVQDGTGKSTAEVLTLKNGVLEYEVRAPKDEKVSQLYVQFQIAAFNDIQTKSALLKIKDIKDELKIETVTFRDKIEPNSKEKWSVKITGKEKINAEVLANMYDKSLDQFAVNTYQWEKLAQNFTNFASYSIEKNLAESYYSKTVKFLSEIDLSEPEFIWFDGNVNFKYLREERIQIINNVIPEPVKAAKVETPVMRLQSLRLDDDVIDLLNSGRKLSEEEKRQLTDIENFKYGSDGLPIKDFAGEDLNKIPVRQNLNETAFFYPDLKTDANGNVNFEFTSPEALTSWKLMFLAHTKDARAAVLEKDVITQKEFSVSPNYPRFLREGDELNLQSKLSNLTDKKLSGTAQLQILDAFTNEDISSKFGLNQTAQNFGLAENGNSALSWKISVPKNVSSVILKVVAKAGKYSDGEQIAVAVLPNRILITEAVPVFVKEGETKTFVLENLKNANSSSITNVSNTLELTTNPIWEIMFALPSLKNDTNSSADVIFNKWFADVLASEIFKANPKIKTVFDEYQNKGLLMSNLEKNQELKQILLDETPWILESKNETEQMQKLALLFDANTMKNSLSQDWDDFAKLQNPDGGFSWYNGYPSSLTTSLYILKNLGKLNLWLKENIKNYENEDQKDLVKKLTAYVDAEISKSPFNKENALSDLYLNYLDARNYWEKEYPFTSKVAALKTLVKQQAKTAKTSDFTFYGLHRMALLTNNYGLKDVSDRFLKYLKETSVESKTQGVYWKQNLDDWGWFRSKVVNHAGALEAFNTLTPNDQKFIEEMKIWLITQKEVNSWGSSRGTAEVIFTILNSGKSWTSADSDKAEFLWGKPNPNFAKGRNQISATGYIKQTITSDEVDRNLATVVVRKPGTGIVQGGLFWQYYEDLDKIKSTENYLSVTKELYRKVKTVNGEELQKITPSTLLKVGDKVTVRMIINTDRAMEFIHVKDMRAAGFEPLDVISGYQWKTGLGYYQSTKDASTNFYIEYMPKGKYVFEYDFVANASGKFSNGITTVQNYYAPQMNANTKGSTVIIQP
ncbi:hypothetical protein ASG01_13870 [Chryseobacterium sp. Leaf180]|uniref:alpha-2-macroglobulin family protein n=1 Tax=Chryseobacterium sp. Leaf180 TaxID=1736289 RepID=UPI0006F4885C|nr:alpha-2-macroglobulin family protein [Chryseobacterium sp. Leaf180]KQR91456.1 hypothetical protein ASG01_13870 [Chryseobacterium sp. Leaf180]